MTEKQSAKMVCAHHQIEVTVLLSILNQGSTFRF